MLMQYGMRIAEGSTVAEMHNGIWRQKYIMKCEKKTCTIINMHCKLFYLRSSMKMEQWK